MSPREFWQATFAECLVRLRGYYLNMGYRSADFRSLLTLTYNINSKHKKNPQQLWPLNIDTEFKPRYTDAEIKQRNDKIREMIRKTEKK